MGLGNHVLLGIRNHLARITFSVLGVYIAILPMSIFTHIKLGLSTHLTALQASIQSGLLNTSLQ